MLRLATGHEHDLTQQFMCHPKRNVPASAQEHMFNAKRGMPLNSNDKTLRFHRNVSCDWLSSTHSPCPPFSPFSCRVKMEHMFGRCAMVTRIIRRVLSLPFKNLLAFVQIAFSTDEKGRNRVTTNGRNASTSPMRSSWMQTQRSRSP